MPESFEWDIIHAIAEHSTDRRRLDDVNEMMHVGEPLEALLHLAWIATVEKDRVPQGVRLELASMINSYGDESAPADLIA